MSFAEPNEDAEEDRQLSANSHTFNALHRGIHETRQRRNSYRGLKEHLNESVQSRSGRLHSSVENRKKSCGNDCEELWFMATGKWMHLLLFAGIPAILANVNKWGDVMIFTSNFLVMMPLASILGDLTEIVASHTGESIGGLVNATFGNAVELIITIIAIRAKET